MEWPTEAEVTETMIENLILDSELGPDPDMRLATRREIAAFEVGKKAASLPEWEAAALRGSLETEAERECFEAGREVAEEDDEDDL